MATAKSNSPKKPGLGSKERPLDCNDTNAVSSGKLIAVKLGNAPTQYLTPEAALWLVADLTMGARLVLYAKGDPLAPPEKERRLTPADPTRTGKVKP